MDEGTLFLVIALVIVSVVLGGYVGYLARRGRAVGLSIAAHAAKEAGDEADM